MTWKSLISESEGAVLTCSAEAEQVMWPQFPYLLEKVLKPSAE